MPGVDRVEDAIEIPRYQEIPGTEEAHPYSLTVYRFLIG
jgi:hypothetical protein